MARPITVIMDLLSSSDGKRLGDTVARENQRKSSLRRFCIWGHVEGREGRRKDAAVEVAVNFCLLYT